MKTGLLILDMLNPFDFPEARQLLPAATKAAKSIYSLKTKLKKKRVPVIYVNDNFGNWRSDWKAVYKACTEEKRLGADIARLLKPDDDDYFILKPRHSGFYQTTLETFLRDKKIQRLILTGIAGNICVLFTAYDAHMRDYEIVVPRDCIASNTKADDLYALRQVKSVFKGATPLSKSL